jgi:hypothetical protein
MKSRCPHVPSILIRPGLAATDNIDFFHSCMVKAGIANAIMELDVEVVETNAKLGLLIGAAKDTSGTEIDRVDTITQPVNEQGIFGLS